MKTKLMLLVRFVLQLSLFISLAYVFGADPTPAPEPAASIATQPAQTIADTEPGTAVTATAPIGITGNQIGDLERQLLKTKQDYLTQRGWSYNCDNPGSIWLWQKSYPSNSIPCRVDFDTAVNLELAAEFSATIDAPTAPVSQ